MGGIKKTFGNQTIVVVHVREHLTSRCGVDVLYVNLLPPYSQNGTDPSFCARYGGLKLYLYSNLDTTWLAWPTFARPEANTVADNNSTGHDEEDGRNVMSLAVRSRRSGRRRRWTRKWTIRYAACRWYPSVFIHNAIRDGNITNVIAVVVERAFRGSQHVVGDGRGNSCCPCVLAIRERVAALSFGNIAAIIKPYTRPARLVHVPFRNHTHTHTRRDSSSDAYSC